MKRKKIESVAAKLGIDRIVRKERGWCDESKIHITTF